jgi:uncharacterized lipoprotein
MQLRFGLITALSALSLSGCSMLGISNGSLDYKKASTIDSLEYPEGSMVRPATPLYPAPIVDPRAIENAPQYVNGRGNRFDLPRPDAVATPDSSVDSQNTDSIGRPQPITDGNQNPLLKIDGNSAAIWQYTLATLSSLNHTVVGQSKNGYAVTIKLDQKSYVLRLSPVGTSNSLAVFNTDDTFADKTVSAELLAQIYQNWPA